MDIREQLLELQDLNYKQFIEKLIPTMDPDKIIGVRVPQLRKIVKTQNLDEFIKKLPHKTHEENLLHGLCLNQISDLDNCLDSIRAFIPYLDNWSVVDTIYPKVLKQNREKTIGLIDELLASNQEYICRLGIRLLLSYYVKDETIYQKVVDVQHDGYYVLMMKAWFFCEAIIVNEEQAIKVLENEQLDVWTHNKTISKCVDSFRLNKEIKEKLKSLKR